MTRIKCVSVRLASLARISDKAYLAESHNGQQDVIPASCIIGPDFEVSKSDAYWIAEWILPKKNIQYSAKKVAWFDKDTHRMLPTYTVTTHKPDTHKAVDSNEIDELKAE